LLPTRNSGPCPTRRILEYAQVFGKHSYGTPKKWLEESRNKGLDLVLEIDVQGAAQVKQKLPESVAIFILPRRAKNWSAAAQPRQDSDEEIARRLQEHAMKLRNSGKYYDFCVVNEMSSVPGVRCSPY